MATEENQSCQFADEVSKEKDEEKVPALEEPSDAPIKLRNAKAERKKEEALLRVIAKETKEEEPKTSSALETTTSPRGIE